MVTDYTFVGVLAMILAFLSIGLMLLLHQKQKEIVDEQEQSKQIRKKNAMSYLHMNLMRLVSEVSYHRSMLMKFYDTAWRDLVSDVPDEQSTEKWIRIIKDQTIRIGENIRYTVLSSSDVLDPNLSHQLGFVQDLATKPFDLVPEQSSFDLMDCDGLIEWLASILKEYFDYSDEQLKNMGVTEYDLK